VRPFGRTIQIEGQHFILKGTGAAPVTPAQKATEIHLTPTRACGWSLAAG
jgi:hypothetical protein